MIKSTLAALGIALLAAVVILGGWRAGWWFQAQNAQFGGQVNRNSYAFQQAARDRITTEIGDVFTINTQMVGTDPAQTDALKAQRKAVTAMVCRDATQITGDPLPTDQLAFISQNCTAGAVSPASPYAH